VFSEKQQPERQNNSSTAKQCSKVQGPSPSEGKKLEKILEKKEKKE